MNMYAIYIAMTDADLPDGTEVDVVSGLKTAVDAVDWYASWAIGKFWAVDLKSNDVAYERETSDVQI